LLVAITIAFGLYGWFFEELIKMRWLTITIVAVFVSLLGFSVFIGLYGRHVTADYTEDVALVLGAGISDGQPRPSLQRRLDKAVAYHRQNPAAMILVTGGYGYSEAISEAEAMARYLVSHGVPRAQIIIENAAVSTYTNMSFSRVKLDYYFDHPPRAVIITSDFHMFRSARFAYMQGIDATVYPSSTPLLSQPFYYVREVAAVIKMWVIGR